MEIPFIYEAHIPSHIHNNQSKQQIKYKYAEWVRVSMVYVCCIQ